METTLNTQDYETRIHLNELHRTIEYARLRCLSSVEIISKISVLDQKDDGVDYIAQLFELELNASELGLLERAMTKLARRSERAQATLKRRLDRIVLRLVRLLPSELAAHFAEPYVDHHHKARRAWA